MKKLLTSIPLLLFAALTATVVSIFLDYGSKSWLFFQRSGSLVVLFGAMLSYRSLFRDGYQGYGGINTQIQKVKLGGYSNTDGTVKIIFSDEQKRQMKEAFWDKIAGYIGAILIIYGTIIWGYGDLLGAAVNRM